MHSTSFSLCNFLKNKDWKLLLIKDISISKYNFFYINEGGKTYKFYSNLDKEDLDLEGRHKEYSVFFPKPYQGIQGSIEEQSQKGVVGLYYLVEEVRELNMFDVAHIELATGDIYFATREIDGTHCFKKNTSASLEKLIISGSI